MTTFLLVLILLALVPALWRLALIVVYIGVVWLLYALYGWVGLVIDFALILAVTMWVTPSVPLPQRPQAPPLMYQFGYLWAKARTWRP